METTELSVKNKAELSSAIEQVMIQGDLSKLNPEQRVEYYKTVCDSVGLNPYTRPFDYISLNGKLTLYARKDATDQLRKIHGVNIDDINQDSEGDWFIVTVKGSDKTGRRDVEVGCVNKKDMQGNFGNAMMKAVTKAKRRLTLSLCGLGWLDETEVETIPSARAVIVDDNGVIEANPVEAPRIDSKAVVSANPTNNTPKVEKPVEAQDSVKFDEHEFLRSWKHKVSIPVQGKNVKLMSMELQSACQVKDGQGKEYGTHATERLYYMMNAIMKKIPTLKTPDAIETYTMKLSAINEILTARASALEQLEAKKDPFVKGDTDVQEEH